MLSPSPTCKGQCWRQREEKKRSDQHPLGKTCHRVQMNQEFLGGRQPGSERVKGKNNSHCLLVHRLTL